MTKKQFAKLWKKITRLIKAEDSMSRAGNDPTFDIKKGEQNLKDARKDLIRSIKACEYREPHGTPASDS